MSKVYILLTYISTSAQILICRFDYTTQSKKKATVKNIGAADEMKAEEEAKIAEDKEEN